MKVAFHTLGCKLNFAETSFIARQFRDKGFEQVDFNEKAEVYVINTCTVTRKADKKSKEAIKKARNQNPGAIIVVMGCYAQLYDQKVAEIKGVDLILGNTEKFRIFDYIRPGEKNENPEIHTNMLGQEQKCRPAFSLGDRTRSFLKVQDGCDYKCAYCTIPMARGKSRNQSIRSLVEEAKIIAESGVKEIVLTGVNIGDFGKTTGESFADLIKNLDRVPGIERYRISSIEPNLLDHTIIRLVTESDKFLPHFHIPLQSGSNDILAKMKRRYKRELFQERINAIRDCIPDAYIGVDVITGFPGESGEKFRETYEFLKQLDVSYYHVFPYSERPGTRAAKMNDKVPPGEIKARSQQIQKLADHKQQLFYNKHLGEKRNVLFEKSSNREGKMFGFSDNYIKLETDYRNDWAGEIINVKLNTLNIHGNVEIEPQFR
jgi:threonylcarbamoyladenosine tRNA methylthiotransferase MtaB